MTLCMKPRWLAIGLVAIAAMLATSRVVADDAPPDFARQVTPILAKYCAGCHNSTDKEGGLVLETFASLSRGGDNGPVVVASDTAKSKLLLVLTGKAEPAMPPEGSEPPSAEEIGILQRWIEAGAIGPADDSPAPTLSVPQIPLTAPARRAVFSAAWSADGKWVALGRYSRVELISAESRLPSRTLAGPAGNVTALAFSRDGARLYAAGGEPGLYGEVAVIDCSTDQVVQKLKGHKDSLYAMALSPDGKLLATGGYDQKVLLWDLTSGQPVATLDGHSGAVFDLAFAREGKLLASASADRTIKLWDVASRSRLDTLAQPLGEQYTVAFSPDGKVLVAGGADIRIRVWELSATAQEGANPLTISKFAHQRTILRLAFSPDGATIASAAEDGGVRLFDATTLAERHALEAQPDWPTAIAFSPDNKQLLVARADGGFRFYALDTGAPLPPPKPELAALAPRGAQRGATSRLRVSGKHLAGELKLELDAAPLAAKIVEQDSAGAWAIVEAVLPGELQPGDYDLTATSAAGKSNAVRLHIDTLPQLVAAESDGAASLGETTLPAGIWGDLHVPGDSDFVRFRAEAGQTIVFELTARSIGSKLNGVLTLTNSAGAVLASNNDYQEGEDPLLAHTFQEAGSYLLRVNDLTQAGSPEHYYRLTIGALPYVTACYPLGVPADRESEVELIGWNLADARVKLPAAKPGELNVPLDAATQRFRKPLRVIVESLPEAWEVEPNNQPAEATSLVVPGTANGRIMAAASSASADVDLVRFDSKAGEEWIIETNAARRSSPIDTRIEVLDIEGRPIPRVLLQATRASAINFRGIDAQVADVRVDNWEEMELNEYLYLGGEVARLFRMPQGPDSGFLLYERGGSRVCYFDTSATAHAVADACYIVQPQPPGTPLANNGLPVFSLSYSNDDDGQRQLGRDSRLSFTAPGDGQYLVRVSDVRGMGGDRYAYRLTIRRPQPDFHIAIGGANPTIPPGSGRNLTFTADRIDGHDSEVKLEVTGLPPGFAITSPIVIPAGYNTAQASLYVAADAPAPTADNAKASRVSATSIVQGSPVAREVGGLGELKLGGKPSVTVRIEPTEIQMAPGGSAVAKLKIERSGFEGRVLLDAENLPHGVIVDNIGLNGVLIPEGQTEREIFLTAREWVGETTRPFHVVTLEPGGEASPPVMLSVRNAAAVAKAADGVPPETQE
jgi:DNA-binding beta-propeller fold protein YncE